MPRRRADIARPAGEPITLETPLIATCELTADYARRHPGLIRRRCEPVACDVGTRRPLYDVEAATDAFRDTPRRVAV